MRTPFQPRWLDRYYLCEELATGGMATVFGALYVGPGGFQKPCAVKLMHPHLTHDEGFVQMFEDEARIAACIDHPNVCRVTDYGVRQGDTYLVMELLDGQNFWTVFQRLIARPGLRQEPDFPTVLARVALDACEGLHAAHEARALDGEPLHVVHRDISLSNLFLSRDGTVRVVDFGVVKSVGRVHHTATGCFKGKLAYLAPEYLLTGTIDRRADLFALGVVLWEMLAGRRLHAGLNEVEIFRSVMANKSTPLRELCPGLPPGLGAIVDRAMSLDPDQRYPTARAMADDLGRYLVDSGRYVSATEVSAWLARVAPVGPSPVRSLIAQQASLMPHRPAEDHRILPPPLPLVSPGVPRLTVPLPEALPPIILSPFGKSSRPPSMFEPTAADVVSPLVLVPTTPPPQEPSFVHTLSLADVEVSLTPPILRPGFDTLVDPVDPPVTSPRAALSSTLSGLGVPASLVVAGAKADEAPAVTTEESVAKVEPGEAVETAVATTNEAAVAARDALASSAALLHLPHDMAAEPRPEHLSRTLRGLGPSDQVVPGESGASGPSLSLLDAGPQTDPAMRRIDVHALADVPPVLLGPGLLGGVSSRPPAGASGDEPTHTAYPLRAPTDEAPASEPDSDQGPSTSQLLPLVRGNAPAAVKAGDEPSPASPEMEPSALFQLSPAMLAPKGGPVLSVEAPGADVSSLEALSVPTEPLFSASVEPPAPSPLSSSQPALSTGTKATPSSSPPGPMQPVGGSSLDITQSSALAAGPSLASRWLRPVQGLAAAAALSTLGLFAHQAMVHDTVAPPSAAAVRPERVAPVVTATSPVVAATVADAPPAPVPVEPATRPDAAAVVASAGPAPVVSAAPVASPPVARAAEPSAVAEPRDTAPASSTAPASPAPPASSAPATAAASATAPGPVAQTGRVMISTPGGSADVLFQGRALGNTPVTVTLPVGPQTIELRTPDMGASQPFGVNVQEGRTVLYSIPVAQLVP